MAIQAGAVVFGVVGLAAIVAVTAAIIIIRKSQQKKLAYKSDNSIRHNDVEYRYDPDTKTIVESSAPIPNDPNNNLRKRSPSTTSTTDKNSENLNAKGNSKIAKENNLKKRSPSTASTTDKKSENSSDENAANLDDEQSDKSNNTKNNSKVAKEVQTDPIDVNHDIDRNKVLPDKVLMPMSAEEKVINYLSGDIPLSNPEPLGNLNPVNNLETLSTASSTNWSNLSSEKTTDNSEKAYKKRILKSLQKHVTDMIQKNCELLAARSDENSVSDAASGCDNPSTSSASSNISSVKSVDDFETAYKKTVRKTLKGLVKDMGNASRAPSESSEESEFSIISGVPEKCFTCEENHVNTSMQPCSHRYLCSDCAPKVLRVQNKCKMCRVKIERIVVEE